MGRTLSELRKLKKVVAPDETEYIGNYWFWGSDVESVTLPSDIRKIGVEAFCNCKKLEKLTFKKVKAKKNSTMNDTSRSKDS